MTEQNPDPVVLAEAQESPPAPPAPNTPPTPPVPPEPALAPVKPAPESVENVKSAEGGGSPASDPELEFDNAEIEFATGADDHPSKQPVASRPTPAGPSSQPPERVARARDENSR